MSNLWISCCWCIVIERLSMLLMCCGTGWIVWFGKLLLQVWKLILRDFGICDIVSVTCMLVSNLIAWRVWIRVWVRCYYESDCSVGTMLISGLEIAFWGNSGVCHCWYVGGWHWPCQQIGENRGLTQGPVLSDMARVSKCVKIGNWQGTNMGAHVRWHGPCQHVCNVFSKRGSNVCDLTTNSWMLFRGRWFNCWMLLRGIIFWFSEVNLAGFWTVLDWIVVKRRQTWCPYIN